MNSYKGMKKGPKARHYYSKNQPGHGTILRRTAALLTLLVAVCSMTMTNRSYAANLTDGLAAYEAGDYAVAWEMLLPEAKSGSALARFNVGYMRYHGHGVERDLSAAARWYKQAADQGEPSAQYNLGYLYQQGEGVPRNLDKAVFWYGRAAEAGHVLAQYGLGHLYERGRGLTGNLLAAERWYQTALDNGFTAAEKGLKRLQKLRAGEYWQSVGDRVNVRQAPAPSAEILGKLSLNQTVLVLESEGEWHRIFLPGSNQITAWVFADLLRPSR